MAAGELPRLLWFERVTFSSQLTVARWSASLSDNTMKNCGSDDDDCLLWRRRCEFAERVIVKLPGQGSPGPAL